MLTPVYLAAFALFAVWCYGRERRGRTVHVVAALVWVTLLDAVIYSDTAASFLNGLFHPAILGQNVRTVQLLIPVALAAHVAFHGLPRRWAPTALVWVAFAAWVGFATVNGLLAGFPSALVMRQASLLLYVLGMIALVAATPIEDLLDRRRLTIFLAWVSGLAAALTVATLTGLSVTSAAVPQLPVLGLGALGPDVASLFVTIGLVLGFVELTSPDRRAWYLLLCLGLLLTHVVSDQRAQRIGCYAALAVILLGVGLSRSRRRLRLTHAEVVSTVVVALALVVAVPIVLSAADAAVTGEPASVSVPLADASFGVLDPSHGQGSVESRYNQWSVVRGEIAQQPVVGHGLGATFTYYEESVRSVVWSDLSHNIVLDLLFRMGIVGLVLFLAGVVLAANSGVLMWRLHPDDRVAALGLAATAAMVGLLTRGQFESIFEKYRLAVALGVLIGAVLSARSSYAGQQEMLDRRSDRVPEAV